MRALPDPVRARLTLPLVSFFDPGVPQEEFFSRVFIRAVGEHLGPAVQPFVLGAALAAVLTGLAIVAAPRLGMLKRPRDRDIHVRPTPVLGGAAMFIAFAVAVLLSLPGGWERTGLLALTGVTAAIFIVDDRRGIPAALKLAIQLAVGLVAVIGFGFAIGFVTVPGFGIVDLGWLSAPLTLLWLLGMENTVNLLDGIDGLAAGVVAIVALTLMVAASTRGQPDVVAVSAVLAGVCAGFLVFNFHPARIFMGDSGSYFLGLALALLSVLGVAKVAVAFALVLPVLALGIPVFDTGWAIVRRRRHGLSIAHADTRHVHHQLLDFGLNQVQACLVFYCGTGILGAAGLMLFGHRRVLAVAVVLLVVPLSTVLGEMLERATWRVPFPGLRRLLPPEPQEQPATG